MCPGEHALSLCEPGETRGRPDDVGAYVNVLNPEICS